jgi:outer membrane protein OmpA-like peptidoglycan-associated protein
VWICVSWERDPSNENSSSPSRPKDAEESYYSHEILFDFDKYSLKLESTIIGGIVASPTVVLWALANQIRQKPFSMVACHGYTDSCGEYGYNLGLSYNRAMSVKTWLTQMRVVPAERVICVPHSFADPAADNSTAEGRRLNRRVVVEVY